jgi:hypothetical protein
MKNVVRILQTEYPVRVYQWVMILLALLVLIGGAIFGVVVYVQDQADNLRALNIVRCSQVVEARHGSRARALTNIDYTSTVLDTIEDHVGIPNELRDELDELEAAERLLVDEQLPVITMSSCLDPLNTPTEVMS